MVDGASLRNKCQSVGQYEEIHIKLLSIFLYYFVETFCVYIFYIINFARVLTENELWTSNWEAILWYVRC